MIGCSRPRYLSSFCLQNKKNLISPTLLDENFSLLVSLKISLNSCSHKFAYDPIKISMFPPNLNCVASLGGDALHGQDNLEGVLPNVPGTHTAIITFNRVTIMVRL